MMYLRECVFKFLVFSTKISFFLQSLVGKKKLARINRKATSQNECSSIIVAAFDADSKKKHHPSMADVLLHCSLRQKKRFFCPFSVVVKQTL